MLKQFCTDKFQQVFPTNEASAILEEINQPVCKIENALRWRQKKVTNNISRNSLYYGGYPLEEATWEPEDNFSDKQGLYEDLENKLIPEEK